MMSVEKYFDEISLMFCASANKELFTNFYLKQGNRRKANVNLCCILACAWISASYSFAIKIVKRGKKFVCLKWHENG